MATQQRIQTSSEKSPVFQFSVRPDKVGIITINVVDEKVNTLKAAFVEQFQNVLKQAQQHSGVKGLIITSGKPDNFIAGADISMIADCKTKEEATALAKAGQDLYSIRKLSFACRRSHQWRLFRWGIRTSISLPWANLLR